MSGILGDDTTMDKEKEEERSSYYGGASVPFIWESRPGTPKNHLFSDSSLPLPLTPPPSYYSSGILSTPKKQSKVRTKLSKFLSMSMFNDLRKSTKSSKKNVNGSSFSWSSTSSSSSFSSPPHSMKKPMSHDKKSPLLYANYEESELRSSPTSTLCYSNGDRKGCCSSMESLKRAPFSGPIMSLKRAPFSGPIMSLTRHGTTSNSLIIRDTK